MALQGAVDDLSDFLQFLVHAGKSGILQVRDDFDTKFLSFQNGQLCYAIHQRRIPDLEEILGPAAAPRRKRDAEDRWEQVVSRALDRRRHLSMDRLRIARMAQEDLTPDQARECLSEIRAQQGSSHPTFRLGEYLVATGQITQRLLERALEEQMRGNRLLGEILIDLNAVSRKDVQDAAQELEVLRGAFSPLYPLQQQLKTSFDVDPAEFTAAASEVETSGHFLWDVLVDGGTVDENAMRDAVQGVLIDELCDLLTWPGTTFQFFENLFIDNVMVAEGFPMVHRGAFDLQSLLLRAHSHMDILKKQGLDRVTLSTIFAVADATLGMTEDFELLMNLDGRRPLADIRRTLPGNRFAIRRSFLKLVNNGQIRPIAREIAFERGQDAEHCGDYGDALAFYEHALKAEGHEPSNTRLRGAVQEVKQHASKTAAKKRSSRVFARHPESFGLLARLSVLIDQMLIRTGTARLAWFFWRSIIRPVCQALAPSLQTRAARVTATAVVALFVIGCAIWMRSALKGISVASAESQNVADVGVVDRYSEQRYIIGAPIEVSPVSRDNQVLVSARDGTVRAVHVSPSGERTASDPRLSWECSVGEYGDLLSSASHHGESIFVSNVRGTVTTLNIEGEIQWQQGFTRLEAIAPVPLVDPANELTALAVVSRRMVHVLLPHDGTSVFTVETGQQVAVRPVGTERRLYVASTDGHVYATNWRDKNYLWDHESSAQVRFLALTTDCLVLATDTGQLQGLDVESGSVRWAHDFPPGEIEGLVALTKSEVAVYTDRGTVSVFRAGDGARVHDVAPRPELGATHTRAWRDRFFYTTDEGYVGEIDRDGRPLWRSLDPVGVCSGSAFGEGFVGVSTRQGELTLFRFQETRDRVNERK